MDLAKHINMHSLCKIMELCGTCHDFLCNMCSRNTHKGSVTVITLKHFGVHYSRIPPAVLGRKPSDPAS
jgi:hypothetical protein